MISLRNENVRFVRVCEVHVVGTLATILGDSESATLSELEKKAFCTLPKYTNFSIDH